MKLFIELLQVALGTREKLSQVPSEAEWNALYEEAGRQAIVGVLFGGLEKLPAEQLPPMPVKMQWIGMVQVIEATYKLHCERAVELTRRFRAVGFHSCILKGIGLAQYYPDPTRRQCGDIDFLVIGCRKDVMQYLRNQYKVGLVVWHHIEAEIFDDVATEIHVHPSWLYGPLRNRSLQRFFENELLGSDKGSKHSRVLINDTEFGFSVPSVSFNVVYSLVHTFHHLIEEGIGLRHIVDYFYVLRNLAPSSFPKGKERCNTQIVSFIESIGLGKFLGAIMWVMEEVCGMARGELLCEPNEKEGKFLMEEIMKGGNFGQYRTDKLVHNSAARIWALLPHYPNEVLWVVPWKIWHQFWKAAHKN